MDRRHGESIRFAKRVMINKLRSLVLAQEITRSRRRHLKDHERKLDVCYSWFTFTVSGNRNVSFLTENIELKGGLFLTDHVLSAAYDHPAIIIRRQI